MTLRHSLALGAVLLVCAGLWPASARADWPTYHLDNTRAGNDLAEPSLTQATFTWTNGVDENVFGTPVVIGNIVVVATENNTVYGLDLTTGGQLWSTHVGTPVTSGLPCGNVNPLGITGTPVIDTGSRTVWVVAEEAGTPPSHHLVGLSVDTGAISHDNVVDPAGQDPTVEQQRAALALANGNVYIAFGGLFGDCGHYHGYLVAASASTGQLVSQFKVATECGSGFGAGIWGASGPAVDGSGNVYVATGNSCKDTNGVYDNSDGVLKFSSPLTLASSFAPMGWFNDNLSDLDLGSIGPLLLSGGQVFQTGKTGIGYILSQAALGGVGGQVTMAQVCPGMAFGGNAYDPATGIIYVPCGGDGINAWRVGAGPVLTHVWGPSPNASTPPILAGGLLWAVNLPAGTLYGLNPATGAVVRTLPLPAASSYVHFASLSASGGHLIVGDGTNVVSYIPPPVIIGPGITNSRASVRGGDAAGWSLTGSDAAPPVFGGPWSTVGGRVVGTPAVVSVPAASGPGTPYYIAVGFDNDLWVRSETTGWRSLSVAPVNCTSSPAATSLVDPATAHTVLFVSCRGGDGSLWYAKQDPAPSDPAVLPLVSGWTSLGGQVLAQGPALTVLPPFNAPVATQLTFYANAPDGNVWTRSLTGAWSPAGWSCLGHLGAAAVIAGATNLAAFACEGRDGGAWAATRTTGGAWTTVSLGGHVIDGAAVALTPVDMTVIAQGGDLALWQRTAATNTLGFGGWTSAGGRLSAGPGAAALLTYTASP